MLGCLRLNPQAVKRHLEGDDASVTITVSMMPARESSLVSCTLMLDFGRRFLNFAIHIQAVGPRGLILFGGRTLVVFLFPFRFHFNGH